MDGKLYPLTFRPNLHAALWGSESWEISGHGTSPSIVAEGPLAGCDLASLASRFGRALVGEAAPAADVFPLLFKVIDARDRLSVQVHPSDATAPLTGGEPKTEMWHVLGGGGSIYAGLKPGTTLDAVADGARTGKIEELLAVHRAERGSALFIPGGMVHAIGADVCVYEVQQSSNTTYRLYDWGRTDANGNPRELHIDEAMKVVDLSLPPPAYRSSVECAYFRFRAVESDGMLEIPQDARTFTAVFVAEERRSVLVPAACAAAIPCNGKVLLTTLAY